MRLVPRRSSRLLGGIAGALLVLATARTARAERLAAEDMGRLLRGETLVFAQTVVSDTHRYIGGVTYTILEASPEELSAILEDTRVYQQLFPRTKEARLVVPPGEPPPAPLGARRDFFVELHQGNVLMEAVYTVHVRKWAGANTFQFWLDPRMPHDIDDAWGFFRYEALSEAAKGLIEATAGDAGAGSPAVLFTYGVLVDVGPGIVRDFFEEKVRAVLLSVPKLVQRYVQANVRLPKKT